MRIHRHPVLRHSNDDDDLALRNYKQAPFLLLESSYVAVAEC